MSPSTDAVPLLAGVGPDVSDCEAALMRAVDAGTTVDADTFLRLTSLAGRTAGPALLHTAWTFGLLDRDALAEAASDVWTMAEYPEQSLGRQTWLDIFTEAGFAVDGKRADRPADQVTLYRGAPKERRRRMAWSSDWSTAAKFATSRLRGRPAGQVWTVDAPPEALLAVILDGREEAEYVIDTRGLKIRPGPDSPP